MDINNENPRRHERRRVSIDGFSGGRPATRPVVRLDYALRREPSTRAVMQGDVAVMQANPAITIPIPVELDIPREQDVAETPQAEYPNASTARRQHRRIDMELPGQESEGRSHPVFRKRLGVLRHWAFKASVGAIILVLLVGGVLFTQGFFNAKKVFKGGAHAAALQPQVDPNLLKGEGDGRINILLLGNGGPGHDGADLTDTMMVASIDPVNNTAVLLSIPRDLWVEVPKHGSMKINAAYAMGKSDYLGKFDSSNADTKAVMAGFKSADSVVESTLGIDIHYNFLVNFSAFKSGVDAVGGVVVNVPEQLSDRSMAWENHGNPVLAEAGIQQFDGRQALMYVRSRHSSSDFARSERQRSVILALKEKAISLDTLSNPVKISQLMSAFGDNMVTDMNLSDASRLYQISKGISGDNIKSISFDDKNNVLIRTGRVGNQSVVMPLAGMYEYEDMRMFVRKALPDGFIIKENSAITVLNGTSISGKATNEGEDLKSFGYNVIGVGNTPKLSFNQTQLIDLTGGKDKYTLNYLEQRFGVKATSQLPGTIQAGQSDFILILGTNETSSR